MATPARVRINCKTPSTGISTPTLKVNSPFPKSMHSTRVATLPVNDDVAEKRRRRLEAVANAASPTIGTPVKRKDGERCDSTYNIYYYYSLVLPGLFSFGMRAGNTRFGNARLHTYLQYTRTHPHLISYVFIVALNGQMHK